MTITTLRTQLNNIMATSDSQPASKLPAPRTAPAQDAAGAHFDDVNKSNLRCSAFCFEAQCRSRAMHVLCLAL